jgi:glycosyltransferase involved in cell wall biosynthesis
VTQQRHCERGARVVIDALAARFGGTAYAAVHLTRCLSERPDIESITVLTRKGSIVSRGIRDDSRVRVVALRTEFLLELPRRVYWEAVRLPGLLRSIDSDVLVTMSGMLPRRPPCPVICLQFNPVMFERHTAANVVRRWALRRTASAAIFVAAPSRAVAERVSAVTGRECAVVPLGVDHGTFSPGERVGDEVLCVSDFYSHKRHDVLLDAWLRLPPPRATLRLIGSPAPDRAAHTAFLERLKTIPERGSIVVESGVALPRLVDAYRRARVFVLASEHESFSMPLAESMSCGVPAVVRALASLQETAGRGAIYVEGNDPADWASALNRLLRNDQTHQRMRAAALEAAAQFSWERFSAAIAAHFP